MAILVILLKRKGILFVNIFLTVGLLSVSRPSQVIFMHFSSISERERKKERRGDIRSFEVSEDFSFDQILVCFTHFPDLFFPLRKIKIKNRIFLHSI